MEHIEEDVQVFKNFHQSLSEKGVLLISTPSDQGGSDVHDHNEGDLEYKDLLMSMCAMVITYMR